MIEGKPPAHKLPCTTTKEGRSNEPGMVFHAASHSADSYDGTSYKRVLASSSKKSTVFLILPHFLSASFGKIRRSQAHMRVGIARQGRMVKCPGRGTN